MNAIDPTYTTISVAELERLKKELSETKIELEVWRKEWIRNESSRGDRASQIIESLTV